MKTPAITALIAATLCLPADATITIIGDRINVGSSNTVNGFGSASLGSGNYNSQDHSLVIGAFNDIQQDDNDYGSFALGHHNYIHGYGSIVGGSYNSVLDNSSITTGFYNYNNAPASLVVGRGNVVEYTQNQNSITAGTYNAAIPYAKPAHLVIGNGTGSAPAYRKNSFIIYADGDIVITKPQGDISMGIYE